MNPQKDSQKASSLNGPPFESHLRWTWSVFAIWLRVLNPAIQASSTCGFLDRASWLWWTGSEKLQYPIEEETTQTAGPTQFNTGIYPLWLAANDRVEALQNCRLVEQSREQHFLDTLFKGTTVCNSLELMCVSDPPKSLALHFLVYGAPSLQHPCKMWQSRRLCPPPVQHAVIKKMDQRNRKKCDAATLGAVAVLWGCQHGQKRWQYNKSVHKENMVTRLKIHQSTLLRPRVWRLPATQSRSPRIRILGRNQICFESAMKNK